MSTRDGAFPGDSSQPSLAAPAGPATTATGPAPELRNFVGGQFVDGVRLFDDLSPVTGEVVAMVHEADSVVVNAAVRAARSAADGVWGRTSVQERVRLLRAVADVIERRFEDLVQAEIADTGKPVSLARELDVARAALNFRSFADVVAARGLDAFLTELPDGTALNYAVPRPLGVVGVIVPWNLPLLLLTWKVAPALACGNTVVVKPSEETPGSATLLAEIMQEAGIPEGVYNIVHGFGPGSAGEFLTSHPGVDAITFTGESRTGAAIMRTVAEHVRPVSFELGGKNAGLVFADADLERAIGDLARSSFLNTGQVCLCTERVYVERPIFDDVVNGLAHAAAALRPGDPYDPATTMGPLISQAHRAKVVSYFDGAVEEGAQVVTGGGIPVMEGALAGGSWIQPTVWTGLDNTASVMREEIFGPAVGIVPFDTEEEAVRLANDTRYGLASAVWTADLDRGHRVARQMRVGMSWVNTWYQRDLRSPFGGSGLSGIGREGGTHSLHFYTDPTNVCVRVGN